MKRNAVFFVLIPFLLCCASCTKETRFGLFELERRLNEIDTEYAFDTECLFRKEGVYHIIYRTEKGTLLLKATEDDHQRLCRISLSTVDKDRNTAGCFSSFSCALVDLFLPEDARAGTRDVLRLEDPGSFFRDETLTASYERYQAVLFKSTEGVSLMLEYE